MMGFMLKFATPGSTRNSHCVLSHFSCFRFQLLSILLFFYFSCVFVFLSAFVVLLPFVVTEEGPWVVRKFKIRFTIFYLCYLFLIGVMSLFSELYDVRPMKMANSKFWQLLKYRKVSVTSETSFKIFVILPSEKDNPTWTAN